MKPGDRVRRLVVPCLTSIALVAGGAALGGSAAATTTHEEFVSVHLASDSHAVARLAHARGLTHADRLRRLRAALSPSTPARDVASYLSEHGFHIVESSPFVVRAKAAQEIVDATFPRTDGHRDLPGELRGDATFVVSSDEHVGVLKPLATGSLTGADIRSLYDAPSGVAPAGHQSPAIATLQFSGWDSGDLSTFAADNGFADPVAAGRYREVSVDGADPATPDGNDGEVEVALDQEALLMTAPQAKQIAYFAPNSGSGILDAIERVARDAYYGANIGALSISYGMCEANLPFDFLDALHQVISDAVAAGVTVFAASGDNGAFECGPGDVSVSSPASDPLVVAVGGTTVDDLPPVATETVWWDGSSGSGGGTSAAFAEPAYQQTRAGSLPGRGLPDISLAGDPASGITIEVDGLIGAVGGTSLASPLAAATFTDVLSSSGTDYGIGDIHRNLYAAPATAFRDITVGTNGAYTAGPGYDLASGLGAPQWSALRNTLTGSPTVHAPSTSRSRTIPVSVSAPPGMVFDAWRIGTTNEPADCGTPTSTKVPTSVTAKSDGTVRIYLIGYTNGGYCYIDHAKTRVDTVAPVTLSAVHATSKHSIRFSWAATDHLPSTGVINYRVRVFKAGSAATAFAKSRTTRQKFLLRHAKTGATYVVRVSAVDGVGNRSKVSTARIKVR